MAPVSSEAAKRKTLSRERALAMGRLIYPSVPFAGVCRACLGSLLQRAASIASCRGSRPFATSPRFGTRVEPPPIFRRFLIVIEPGLASVAGNHPGQGDLTPLWMEGRWFRPRRAAGGGTWHKQSQYRTRSAHGRSELPWDGDSCRRRRLRASAHWPWATARDVVAF